MAAAYAALVSLFNNLEDIQNHPRHSFSFDNNQIQSLVESITFLIEFMESFDNCHGPSNDAAQLLERQITCAAQAAEEVIESHVVEQIRGGSTLGGKKRSPCFLLDVEKVIQDIDSVRRKAIKIQQAQRDGVKPKQPPYSASTQLFSSEKNTNTMVGFDDLLLQLLDMLTGYPSSRRVISIVGTGGVGKTTLAKNAFEHSLTVQHFDVCLWATISQQYVEQDILSTLLSRDGKSNGEETVGELGEQLHKRLRGRRYLIVLDDMWSVTVWDEMKFFFPDTSNGSRIVVTTRQSNVAHLIGSSLLAISLLDDDKSWDLFCQKAFPQQGCHPELEDVGKNIVRKCKGLPLAIVVIAGHLRTCSTSEESWENVEENMKSILINSEENKHFINILSFSYRYLPIHLKPLFVYMGTFPEDEEIDVPDLIRRWIAEGFLNPCKGDNLEEIARDYLKDLIGRNLIVESTNEKGSYCKIHDLLRELCLNVAEKEMFFYVLDAGKAICRERRVRINEEISEEPYELFHAPGSVHLVRSLKWDAGAQLFDLKLCRVLSKCDELLLNENGGFLEADLQQVNLRYLKYHIVYQSDVSGSLYLPSSMTLFWNLQTLVIGGILKASFIAPNEIWEMIHLRHLEVILHGIHLLDPLPSELVMRNLQSFLGLINFKFSEEVCRRVPNIKELQVKYDHLLTECDDLRSHYYPHNLGCLSKLESLTLNILDYDRDSEWREFSLSLTFPSSLKKLSLRNTCVDWEEMTMMVGFLPHLETLILYEVIGSEWNVVEGTFLHLKSLTIRYCSDLDCWNATNSHFPVLENLVIEGVFQLDEFPPDIGTKPTLRSIILNDCSVSFIISAVRILVEQEEEQGIEDLRIDVHCWGDEDKLEKLNKKVEEVGLESSNFFIKLY